MTLHLLIKNRLNTATNRINHVEVHHSLAQTLIAVEFLLFVHLQRIFNRTREERTRIRIIQVIRRFHEINALAKRIILVRYRIM